ncbi:antibiotic acetyltransferase [Loktanella sp. D2R18]|uniref:CatB-related O-acetyltransferase n=1 Tax=Yoonia sp. 1_MG-2023 TaxID=3062659 RepID=UPI000DE81A53|nr:MULTISPECIES: CatB-related O-acetyltransferase [Rhodobacterales]MDO6592110.1 CatB-related O-acetyltransferase [Yoonia sp. 1_MG-2023]RBW42732.1 antibiotic acetyltransferase [Loktanella sp. D2R18]
MREFYNPLNEKEKVAGKIRGPVDNWNVKGRLHVGYHSSINGRLKVRGQVYIGRYCAIGDECRLFSTSHHPQVINLQIWLQTEVGASVAGDTKGPIKIGNNVWIGDNVSVMSGVTVGDGAILAAGSVVTRDVAPYSIVAGSAARHVRYRFCENVRKQLAAIQWWNWDEDRLKRNTKFFDLVLDPETDVDLSKTIVD